MSITITVYSSLDEALGAEESTASRLTFDAPRVVIGRAASSEVRLPDTSVSLRHLSIRQRGPQYVLIDEGSRNGTRIGRKKLTPHTPHVLEGGERVRVGRVVIDLQIGHEPCTAKAPAAAKGLALQLLVKRLSQQGEDVRPQLTIDGETRALDHGVAIALGRSRDADWAVGDEACSRRHLEVAWRGGDVSVRDLGSKAGTLYAAEPLAGGRDRTWVPGEVVTIGKTELSLRFEALDALEEAEAAEDERLSNAELELGADTDTAAEDEPDDELSDDSEPDPEELQEARSRLPAAVASAHAKQSWSATDFAVVLLAFGVFSLSAVGYFVLLR